MCTKFITIANEESCLMMYVHVAETVHNNEDSLCRATVISVVLDHSSTLLVTGSWDGEKAQLI